MALNLVDYGSDSDSDEEMDESSPSINAIIPPPKKTLPVAVNPYKEVNEDDADIPMPSQKELELAELAKREKANIAKLNPLSQLAQKKNGKIVIGIPSLADLEEDEADEKKVKKPTFSAQKGQSQLFTKLPPPKNSRYEPPVEPVLPNLDKPAVPKKSNPLIPQSVAKKQIIKRDSDDEDEAGGFFTLDEPALKPVAFVPIPAPMVHNQLVHQGPIQQDVESGYYPIPTNQDYNMAGIDMAEAGGSGEGQMELDAVALQALQGASGVKRKMTDDMEMIEVRAERLSYDPNMSYLKGISEEKTASSGPDITYNKLQKKKHQITYLAAQAKAREVDLKNQWAQNKSTRRQTQAKYGF